VLSVWLLRLTAKPDEAVALMPKSASPYVLSVRAPKVIVWSAFVTVKVCVPLVLEVYVVPEIVAPANDDSML
jgi:hypothetical protein